MARQFGSYSPSWPLGTTLEEVLLFQQEDGAPVDLTGCQVRMQIREAVPVRDPDTGQGEDDPVLELVSDAYATPPAWPVLVALQVGQADPSDGTILLKIDPDDSWTLSPDNSRRKLVYDIEILDTDSGDVLPLVQGKITTLPRRTLEAP